MSPCVVESCPVPRRTFQISPARPSPQPCSCPSSEPRSEQGSWTAAAAHTYKQSDTQALASHIDIIVVHIPCYGLVFFFPFYFYFNLVCSFLSLFNVIMFGAPNQIRRFAKVPHRLPFLYFCWSYSLEFTAWQSAQSSCWTRAVSTNYENPPVCLLLAFRWQGIRGVFTYSCYTNVHLLTYLHTHNHHMHTYHVFRKKTPTYIFNYNSSISWSIFIIFVPVERELNTLQYTYLQSWWRHNCVTLHVTKVYFMELKMNIGTTLLKNTHFSLDYNSGISWSIFILFELLETGMNTLQRINKIYNTTLTVSPHYLT